MVEIREFNHRLETFSDEKLRGFSKVKKLTHKA